MPSKLSIDSSLWERMIKDIEEKLPEEACGLIAGQGERGLDVIPVENIYHSPYRYRMDPGEQLAAFQFIEEQNWELLAIYHSHPQGPVYPSSTDIREAYYPEAVYVIVSRVQGSFQPKGYSIKNGQIQEVDIVVEQPQQRKA